MLTREGSLLLVLLLLLLDLVLLLLLLLHAGLRIAAAQEVWSPVARSLRAALAARSDFASVVARLRCPSAAPDPRLLLVESLFRYLR